MKPVVLFIALCALIFSCDYEPFGAYVVDLPQPDSTGMSIMLTETSDTLTVYGNAEIFYQSIIQHREVHYFQASLDGEPILTQVLGSGSFFVYTPAINNGCYTLRIEINTSSGTGSLADIRQKESLRVTKSYVLCVDNSRPSPITMATVRRSNGTLVLTWEKYGKANFQQYKLFKYAYNQGYQYYQPHWIREITERDVNSLYDSTFIGGKVKYYISVIAANQESEPFEVAFEDPYPLEVGWAWEDKTSIRFSWRRTPYHKNFTLYTVSFGSGDTDQRIFNVDQVNDTTLLVDAGLIFPRTKRVIVAAYPVRIDNYHPDFVFGDAVFHLGSLFPWYDADIYDDHSVYNPVLNSYFALQRVGSGHELIRIGGTTNEVEQAYAIPTNSKFHLSDNGQYLYISNGDSFTRLDPTNFSVVQTYDIALLCGSSGGNWQASVSGNNRIAVTNISGSFVLDMDNFVLVQQWPFEQKPVAISSTGAYVIRGSDLLTWNGTQYAFSGVVGATRSRIFIEGDSKILLDKISYVEVFDPNALTVLRTITLQEGYNLRYDPVSGLLGGITSPYSGALKKFALYSLNSNQKIKDFDVAGGIVLMNNALVTPGYIQPLSFYFP